MAEMVKGEIVEVPSTRLSREALFGLVEEFVSREGTDYGHTDVSLADKRDQVLSQIRRGEVVIIFDSSTQHCDLVLRRDRDALFCGSTGET